MDRIFPDASSENRVICVPSKGSKNPFSHLMTDMMSDLQLYMNFHNASRGGDIRNLRTHQTQLVHFKVLTKHRSVLTTSQTQR